MSSDGRDRVYNGQTLLAILQMHQDTPSTPDTSNVALDPPHEERHFFIASTAITSGPDAARHTIGPHWSRDPESAKRQGGIKFTLLSNPA